MLAARRLVTLRRGVGTALRRRVAVATATETPHGSHTAAGPLSRAGAVRTVMTKMRRKRIRKQRAREIRALIKYAERYDPMRQCLRTVYKTLKDMGWAFTQNHFITEGCHTMFALPDQMIAIEVVSPEEFAEPPASNVAPIDMAHVLSRTQIEDAREGVFIPKTTTEFVHATLLEPPTLCADTQAKHDLIQAKGWDLMVIYQPDWASCLQHPRQKLARYDYIIQRALRLRGDITADQVNEQDSEDEWTDDDDEE